MLARISKNLKRGSTPKRFQQGGRVLNSAWKGRVIDFYERSILLLLELLNEVWGQKGCPIKGQTMGLNCRLRFGFCGSTVLVASIGHPVSFNTTVGAS